SRWICSAPRMAGPLRCPVSSPKKPSSAGAIIRSTRRRRSEGSNISSRSIRSTCARRSAPTARDEKRRLPPSPPEPSEQHPARGQIALERANRLRRHPCTEERGLQPGGEEHVEGTLVHARHEHGHVLCASLPGALLDRLREAGAVTRIEHTCGTHA